MSGKQDYQPVEVEEGAPVVHGTEVAPSSVKSVPMVEVVAPATLPEGYSFEAEVGDSIITVTVPQGGVEQGQRFMVPAHEVAAPKRSNVPVGAWKDGLCNCCDYGPCHPQCCLTCWCRPCALGQVMQRLNLTWLADYAGPARASSTFATIFWLYAAYWIIQNALGGTMMAIQGSYSTYDSNGYDPYHSTSSRSTPADLPASYYVFYFLSRVGHLAFFVFMVVLTTKTRSYIRNKYAIPEYTCKGCEDCCCSFWCGPCTVCQMARHTADYDTYAAQCCTATGLPPNAPAIV